MKKKVFSIIAISLMIFAAIWLVFSYIGFVYVASPKNFLEKVTHAVVWIDLIAMLIALSGCFIGIVYAIFQLLSVAFDVLREFLEKQYSGWIRRKEEKRTLEEMISLCRETYRKELDGPIPVEIHFVSGKVIWALVKVSGWLSELYQSEYAIHNDVRADSGTIHSLSNKEVAYTYLSASTVEKIVPINMVAEFFSKFVEETIIAEGRK